MVAVDAVVVRRWGRWLVLDPPGAPTPTSLEALRRRLDRPSSAWPAETGSTGRADLLRPDDVVAPVWALAGVLRPDGLHTEDIEGGALVLDRCDLQLLDGLTGPCTAADLLRSTGADPRVLARLVAHGKVRRLGDGASPATHSVEDRHGNLDRLLPTTDDPRHPDDDRRPGRMPVYALMDARHGVPLGLAMVTAAARAHDGGRLTERFEIRRPELLPTILDDLARRSGPAVLLVSDFVWSLEDNLRSAAAVVERNPEVVVVHGGPSAPRYDDDAARFLEDHAAVAHVLVRGEGERTLPELLDALGAVEGRWSQAALAEVAGIAYRDAGSGELVRTADRPRKARLDDLPSPYLTGELDHITVAGQVKPFALETNRGCPYACAFCDWGSATNSRVRFFSPERVAGEIAWLAERGADAVFVADANFGLSKRDVVTARLLAEARARTGAFAHVYWTAAKNTTKHLMEILQIFRDGGVISDLAISLQTTDERTLEVIGRSNISTERLLDLARLLRRAGMPVRSELMLGLPGQTYESFRADLQLMFDQQMVPLVWTTLALPNAPLNEPGYRSRWRIRIDDRGVVRETATATEQDRDRMLRLRRAFLAADVYGTLRHLLRWLQLDHGIAAMEVVEELCRVAEDEPDRHLAVTWLVACFDLHPLPPQGWRSFYDDIRAFLVERYDLWGDEVALDCVLEVQRAVMPWPGRTFPATIELPHDYVDYHLDAIAPLYGETADAPAPVPLRSRPPGVLEVRGDPAGLGNEGMDLVGNPRDELAGASYNFVYTAAHELDTPLLRLLPEVPRRFGRERIEQIVAERVARADGARTVCADRTPV